MDSRVRNLCIYVGLIIIGIGILTLPYTWSLLLAIGLVLLGAISFRPELGAILIVFLAPLSPHFRYNIGPYHISPVIFLTTVAFLPWVASLVTRSKLIKAPARLPLALFISFCFVTALYNVNRLETNLIRFGGFLGTVLLAFMIDDLIKDIKTIKTCIAALLISGTILVVVGFFQIPYLRAGTGIVHGARLRSLFIDANMFSACLQLFIPLSVLGALGKFETRRVLMMFLFIGLLISLGLTFSRTGYIALLVVLIILFAFGGLELTKAAKVFGIVAVALMGFAVVLSYFVDVSVLPIFKKRLLLFFTSEERAAIARTALDMFSDSPIMGNALGGFHAQYLEYATTLLGKARHVHNIFIEAAVDTGTIGLGLFMWFIISYFKSIILSLRSTNDQYLHTILLALFASSAGMFLHMLTIPMMYEELFWVAVGLTHAIMKISRTIDIKGKIKP